MNENELEEFSELWIAASENCGFKATPSDAAINLAFDVLERYSLNDIAIAIVKHQRMRNKPLTPAIIESIITGCFWLSADEAWQIAQKYLDKGRSVVIIEEIASAANKVESLYNENQRTAAKAAFVDIYDRMMMQAVSSGKKPHWFLSQLDDRSMGSANDANKIAITEAINQGFISTAKAKAISEKVGCEIVFDKPLQKLLSAAPDETTRAEIRKLKTLFLPKGGEK